MQVNDVDIKMGLKSKILVRPFKLSYATIQDIIVAIKESFGSEICQEWPAGEGLFLGTLRGKFCLDITVTNKMQDGKTHEGVRELILKALDRFSTELDFENFVGYYDLE
ncbi:hypothetical protein KKA15_06300 [Patescibacteria group bacterium]|nr:hypothetical protein [Patescibacteria group bacterium]